jgi:hypothetical protein
MCENGKMRPVETTPGMGERDKGEWRREWIQLWYIVENFCKCHPPYNNNIIIIIIIIIIMIINTGHIKVRALMGGGG